MPNTLAFDIYGTLIDTHGVVVKLTDMVGERAQAFSQAWREKQLEYTFRKGLMRAYENFAVCTSQSLDYTDAVMSTGLTNEQKATLMAEYRSLPAFEDVPESLNAIRSAGHQLYAFSNGTADAIETLLVTASIRELFHGVVTVDDKQTFKPNPDVYQHFLNISGSTAASVWLVSSNPFDIIGAVTQDMRAAWVQRNPQVVFDPWGVEPTVTISSLRDLVSELNQS